MQINDLLNMEWSAVMDWLMENQNGYDLTSIRDAERLKSRLNEYSMSAGMADQYMNESVAAREALGFRKDSDCVSPCDITTAIKNLQEENAELLSALEDGGYEGLEGY